MGNAKVRTVKTNLLMLQEVHMRYISTAMNISRSLLLNSYKQNNSILKTKSSEQNFETDGQTNRVILLCMKRRLTYQLYYI